MGRWADFKASIRTGLTLVGVLLRLLATTRKISRTLDRLADTQARLLKLELIKADIAPDALDEAHYAPSAPGEYLDLHQTDEDFAKLEELRQEAAAKGDRVSLFADLERDLEQEEKGWR